MKLVRGDKLTPDQRKHVLAAYLYRWTIENQHRMWAYRSCPVCRGEMVIQRNLFPPYEPGHTHPTIALQTDEQWLAEHAFHVKANGALGMRPAAPACLAKDTP